MQGLCVLIHRSQVVPNNHNDHQWNHTGKEEEPTLVHKPIHEGGRSGRRHKQRVEVLDIQERPQTGFHLPR